MCLSANCCGGPVPSVAVLMSCTGFGCRSENMALTHFQISTSQILIESFGSFWLRRYLSRKPKRPGSMGNESQLVQ